MLLEGLGKQDPAPRLRLLFLPLLLQKAIACRIICLTLHSIQDTVRATSITHISTLLTPSMLPLSRIPSMRSRCRLGVDVCACVLVTVRGGMSPDERSLDAISVLSMLIYMCVYLWCVCLCVRVVWMGEKREGRGRLIFLERSVHIKRSRDLLD